MAKWVDVDSPDIATTPAPGEVGVGGITVLPDHHNLDDCTILEPNGCSAAIPDERHGNNIHGPTRRTGPVSSLTSTWISGCTCGSPTNSHSLMKCKAD